MHELLTAELGPHSSQQQSGGGSRLSSAVSKQYTAFWPWRRPCLSAKQHYATAGSRPSSGDEGDHSADSLLSLARSW